MTSWDFSENLQLSVDNYLSTKFSFCPGLVINKVEIKSSDGFPKVIDFPKSPKSSTKSNTV